MEILKKTILQAVTTGITACTGSTGTCHIIIPDTGVTYNIIFGLNQKSQDIGFFDSYSISGEFDYIELSGATTAITQQNIIKFEQVLAGETTLAASGLGIGNSSGIVIGTTAITPTYYTFTGNSQSRLSELRKYNITSVFTDQYVSGGSYNTDGVDFANSNSSTCIVYYLGAPKAIKYIDILTGITSGTTFSFTTSGTINNLDFINLPIYKNPNKEKIISNPKINDDVFIVRDNLSAFDKNYRLEYIGNLIDLTTYVGGKYFNIINNT